MVVADDKLDAREAAPLQPETPSTTRRAGTITNAAQELGRLTRVALGAVGAVRCCQSIEREQAQRTNLGGYSLLATALKVCVRLVPTRAIMLTAATPISDAIKAYSIAVTPS